MKKLNKLEINSEKIMKNEELIKLRGGYDGGKCCECHAIGQGIVGYIEDSTPSECNQDCYDEYSGWGLWQCVI